MVKVKQTKNLTVALISLLLVQTCFALNSENDLVASSDYISIFSSTDPDGDADLILELTPFPYIADYTQNKTELGQLCWAPQWANYSSSCYGVNDFTKEQTWVLVTPFDKNYTNELIKIIEAKNDTSYPGSTSIVGLIFDTDTPMTASDTKPDPPIMSEASTLKTARLLPYCYNELSDPSAETFPTKYQHFFVENCAVLDAIVPTYFVASGGWALMSAVSTLYLYVFIPAESRLSLQKSLLLLPALKAIEVFLEGIWLSYCPWVDMSNSAYQYIQMARISIITICYTCFIAIFYLLSKGWQLTVQQLNRNQATNLTMIMGAVYLLYSAYFLSVDFPGIYRVMSIIIACLYAGLAYSFTVNNYKNSKKIAAHMMILDPNQENVMRESFILKKQMIKWIAFGAFGFCVTKFFNFAMINLLSDEFAIVRAKTFMQCLDFLWITGMMIVCRPRKEWPPYFTLSINELPGVEDNDGQRRAALPASVVSMITDKFLFDTDFDDKKSCGSIGSEEAVMFVNPNQYTLDVDMDDIMEPAREISAFDDPDLIQEEANLVQQASSSRDELKKQIENGNHQIDQAHVKAELVLAFRDKKQIKKLAKEKNLKSQTKQRSSIVQRLFRRSGNQTPRVSEAVATSSSDSEDAESGRQIHYNLNHSAD